MEIPLGEWERAFLIGTLAGVVFYGIVIVLFFKCLGALLFPPNRSSESIRWGLVAHTVIMFSCVTIYTTIFPDIQSLCFIDNREFSATMGNTTYSGPFAYELHIYNNGMSVVAHGFFLLNGWLADGLLLYRCCVIYAMNYWVIALPFLMYFASIATGATLIYYQASRSVFSQQKAVAERFNFPTFWISLSLNILLTFMIVTKFILHRRRIQNAMGISTKFNGLYKTTVSMLVESAVLYATGSLLFLVPWAFKKPIANVFLPILVEVQVIAPFLITIRVANRTALTRGIIVAGGHNTLRFRSQEDSNGGDTTITDGDSVSPKNSNGCGPGVHGAELGPQPTKSLG